MAHVATEGNDVITGGLADDCLHGGRDSDSINSGASDGAVIWSYSVANSATQYLAVGQSVLPRTHAHQFDFSGAGVDGNTCVIYDSSTGALYYDADGSGGASAAVQFATLSTGLALTNANFVLGPPPGP